MEVNTDLVNLDAPINDRRRDEFKDYLIESIEEVLSFSKVILNFLELNTDFTRESILENPEVFSNELKDFFGDSANGIENLVIERLYSKIDKKFRADRAKCFKDYICDALDQYVEYY